MADDRMHLTRVFAAGLLAVAVAGCLGACTSPAEPVSPSPSPNPSGMMTTPAADSTHVVETEGAGGFTDFTGFENEYQATVSDLADSLPPGFAFPAEPAGAWDPAGSYENGVGPIQAGFYWQCAWTYTYTQAVAAGDTAEATHALDELATWADLPAVRPSIDELSRQAWLNAVARARTGDDTQLLAMSSTGCVNQP